MNNDWDAEQYHKLSEPQVAWGRRVLERTPFAPGERILDLGCGTGRLTAELQARSGTFVVGADPSPAMVSRARAQQLPHVAFVLADGLSLPFAGAFDVVFSTATFHWIMDHDRLFAEVYKALRPGGRLIAQCGGKGNLARLFERAGTLMRSAAYDRWFTGWREARNFADVADTRERLGRAGFASIDVSLEPAPTPFPDAEAYASFVACVPLRHHLDALPPEQRRHFLDVITQAAADDIPAFTLDYQRLNIVAARGRE